MEFKDMLKYFRQNAGLSQRELAKRLGVSPSTISMYEVGNREPDFETEEKIADYFNVDLNTLRGKDVEASTPAAAPQTTPDQEELLKCYDALNEDGQAKVRDYAADLVAGGRYGKDCRRTKRGLCYQRQSVGHLILYEPFCRHRQNGKIF